MVHIRLVVLIGVLCARAFASRLKCVPLTKPPVTTMSNTPCEPTEFCGRGRFWNYASCSCQIGCDWIEECPQKGYKWDIFQCGCVDACPSVVCEEGYYAEEENCECIPDPDAATTTEGYCPPKQCARGHFWMEYPFCSCRLVCDYAKVCALGQSWDFTECSCVSDPSSTKCPPVFCQDNFVANAKTCGCECSLTESDCPGPRAEFDQSACECRRYPCDPAGPCLEGAILDSKICDCVPDPNYATTSQNVDVTAA